MVTINKCPICLGLMDWTVMLISSHDSVKNLESHFDVVLITENLCSNVISYFISNASTVRK